MVADLRLDVVVPTHETRDLTLSCLAAIGATEPAADRVVVVDDGSHDGTAEAIAERFPSVLVIRNDCAAGFGAAANLGAAATDADIVLFLNSDTEVPPDTVRRLREAFAAPELGVAGAALVYPDGTPQWSGGPRPGSLWLFAMASGIPSRLRRSSLYRRWRSPRGHGSGGIAWVSGAAMAVRSRTWREVGPFATGYAFYGQDLELCLRARAAGWSVRILSEWRVLHHHGATASRAHGGAPDGPPPHLWADLVRWAGREGGAPAARRAARALRLGGWARRRWVGASGGVDAALAAVAAALTEIAAEGR